MGHPILVVNPIAVQQKSEPRKIVVGDILIDTRSTAKDWRKRVARVTSVSITNLFTNGLTLKLADGSAKINAKRWRWWKLDLYKERINVNIQRQHQILTRNYEELASIDKITEQAKEHFK